MSYSRIVVRLLLVALLLVAGCAGPAAVPGPAIDRNVAGEGRSGQVDPAGVDPAMLDAWAGFPADRSPRPIVLIGHLVRESGYHTENGKLAASTGRFQLDVALPAGPATIRTTLPGGAYELPTVTAQQAFEQVLALGKAENAPDVTPAPLRITKVSIGTAVFGTDRGDLPLPAWLFESPDTFEPLAVPALAPSAFWRYSVPTYSIFGPATVSADGATLTARLQAPAPGACPGQPHLRYLPEVVESSTAVVIGLRVEVGAIEPGELRECAYDAMFRTAEYEFRLAAPLGGRVLASTDGNPMVVR